MAIFLLQNRTHRYIMPLFFNWHDFLMLLLGGNLIFDPESKICKYGIAAERAIS